MKLAVYIFCTNSFHIHLFNYVLWPQSSAQGIPGWYCSATWELLIHGWVTGWAWVSLWLLEWLITWTLPAKTMAVVSLGRLGVLLKCSECQGAFTSPKMLQCFHIYCQDCLSKLVVLGEEGNPILTCPSPDCGEVTPVPEGGVKSLQTALGIDDLQEIHVTLCKNSCSIHEGRELELYCWTCGELICLRCAYRDGQHHSHGHQDVEKAFEDFKDTMVPRLEAPERSLDSLLETLSKVSLPSGEAWTSGRSGEHESVQHRLTVLNGLKAELSGAKEKLTSLRRYFRTKKSAKKKEVLLRRNKLLAGFSTVEQIVQSTTSKLKDPDPSLCCLVCKGTELTSPVVGNTAVVMLDVMNFERVPCQTLQLQSLQCVLLSEVTGRQVECVVMGTEICHQYQISYHPTMTGKHQLSVKINDHHVLGSPCLLSVMLPVGSEMVVSRRRGPSGRKAKVPATSRIESTKRQKTVYQAEAALGSSQATDRWSVALRQAGLGSGRTGGQNSVALHRAMRESRQRAAWPACVLVCFIMSNIGLGLTLFVLFVFS